MTDELSRLPHRPPFLLLDRALLVEPGRWAAAVKNIGHGDPYLDARGRWPAVLLAEVMAQVAGLAAAEGRGDAAVLARLDRCRCRDTVAAGDRLLALARVVRRFGASALVRVVLRADRRRCAAAEIVLRFA